MTHHVRWRAIARARGWPTTKIRSIAAHYNACASYPRDLLPSDMNGALFGNRKRAWHTQVDRRRRTP